MNLLKLHFAAFSQVITIEMVPEMPSTATRATQGTHGGRWLFWSEQCSNPVAVWSDEEMQASLRQIAENRAKANPKGWVAVVKEEGQERTVPLESHTETTAWLEAMNRFSDVVRVIPPQ